MTGFKVGQPPMIVGYRQMGYQTVLDYQVFANVPSDFIYRAAKDIYAFAVDREFVKNELLSDDRLQDKILQMQATSFIGY